MSLAKLQDVTLNVPSWVVMTFSRSRQPYSRQPYMRICNRPFKRLGGTFVDVTKITIFATHPEYRQTLGKGRARFMSQPPPASTFVVVTALADPEFLCEVESVITGGS
jgi:hypothetical protein